MPVEKKMNETMVTRVIFVYKSHINFQHCILSKSQNFFRIKKGLNFVFCKIVKKLIMCDHCA